MIAVQRLAGNRATRRLLRDDKPGEIVPKGIDPADAHPLPNVAAPASAATVKADAKLPGGWEDADGKTSSGYVGKMKRILRARSTPTPGRRRPRSRGRERWPARPVTELRDQACAQRSAG